MNEADADAALAKQRIAIVGLGGTGSHVLDFVSRTPVQRIALFDDDKVCRDTLARAPGSIDIGDVPDGARKGTFYGTRYARIHGGVRGYDERLNCANAELLEDYTTVFLCMDGSGGFKRRVLEFCDSFGIVLIDVGMGVVRLFEDAPLTGALRVTTCAPGRTDHAEKCMRFDPVPADEYARNHQAAELNALNAALAVIKWKKLVGIYEDTKGEMQCIYTMQNNAITSDFVEAGK